MIIIQVNDYEDYYNYEEVYKAIADLCILKKLILKSFLKHIMIFFFFFKFIYLW